MSGLGFALRDVRLAYAGREVLRGVDLDVAPGARVALVGPNGAGKSSLLRCLTGLAPEHRGAVLIGDIPLGEVGRERLARRVAVVPGNATLPFAMRVEDVVALGRIPHEHPLRGMDAADRAHVGLAIERAGIGHLVGRDARHLSLGERQLVVLAMALAQAPRLLVLDEPTVHLDLRHQVAVMQLLAELNERDGVTILAVLHALELVAHFFPRAVLLDGGRIVADGPVHDVLEPTRVASVFGVDRRFVPAIAPTVA
jgi:iron complex transport system ATP-binding protein